MAEENIVKQTSSGSRYFYIPYITYFTEGNAYIGSSNTFNFRAAPAGDAIKITIWYGLKCFELSEPVSERSEEKSEEGIARAALFIDEQYEEYLEKIAAGEVEGRRTYEQNNVN